MVLVRPLLSVSVNVSLEQGYSCTAVVGVHAQCSHERQCGSHSNWVGVAAVSALLLSPFLYHTAVSLFKEGLWILAFIWEW